jgi:AhpD family alkylhydroperoxidase
MPLAGELSAGGSNALQLVLKMRSLRCTQGRTGRIVVNRTAHHLRSLGMALGLVCTMGVGAAMAQDADATYRDIEATLGTVPSFFKVFPAEGVAGAWTEFKTVQLNPKTALSGKEKELIGLAVAAQIPCSYCIYFHTQAAKANGATDEEIRETVAMAAITRHWSTVLNGMQVDPTTFRQETDTVLRLAADREKTTAAKQ